MSHNASGIHGSGLAETNGCAGTRRRMFHACATSVSAAGVRNLSPQNACMYGLIAAARATAK
jgi:hypothetical protein